MASPPRRPVNPMDAAEALFKPAPKKSVVVAPVAKPIPEGREMVSLKIDRATLEFFQDDGPGWQDRINDALRDFVKSKS